MKFDKEKTLKYAIEVLGEKENECTFDYLYSISKTTGFAFWNLREELKKVAQPWIDISGKIWSFILGK